jgi:hypothetical protein
MAPLLHTHERPLVSCPQAAGADAPPPDELPLDEAPPEELPLEEPPAPLDDPPPEEPASSAPELVPVPPLLHATAKERMPPNTRPWSPPARSFMVRRAVSHDRVTVPHLEESDLRDIIDSRVRRRVRPIWTPTGQANHPVMPIISSKFAE